MLKTLKKNGKKGFTLAELLIVVAIIAVLTAIAVPLFVGSLTKANKAVLAANERAVRGYAVSEILSKEDDTYKTGGELTGPWYVSAKVAANGDISDIHIAKDTEPTDEWWVGPADEKNANKGKSVKDGDGYIIRLKITTLEPAS